MVDEQQGRPVEPPRGIYPSRVDDKGRLKLPKSFEEFLRGFPEQTFFVTSLDGSIVRIYPMPVWRENEKILEESKDDPDTAEDVAFHAQIWGADSNLDGQGRILVPPELRRELGLENQPVYVNVARGAVEVYSEAVYAQRKARAMADLKDKVSAMRRKGLK